MRFSSRVYWWFKDVWLTIRYGEWVVWRQSGWGSACSYYAVCRRSNDKILCDSKRGAEGIVAINNDLRGVKFTYGG